MPKPRKSASIPPAPAAHWRDALSNERIAHLLKTAFRETSRALQERLVRHGVQYGHWTLLRVLWQTDGLTQRQLATQARVSEPSALAALRQMEALGLVARRKVAGNRRQVRVFLAPRGTALRSVTIGEAEAVNRIALEGLAPTQVAAARQVLIGIIANLQRGELDSQPEAAMARRGIAKASRTARAARRQAA